MEELAKIEGFRIDQSLERLEVLTGFETRNRYDVRTPHYDTLYQAVEEEGSIAVRLLLGGRRPFKITVWSMTDEPVYRVESPFRWVLQEATITGSGGAPMGRVRRRFHVLRRHYEVRDASDGSTFELTGTWLHPWTFEVARDGARCGRVVKRWNGLFREGLSDADRFEVDFPREWPERRKALLLGAALLLDFAHFESRIGDLLDLLDFLPLFHR